MACSSDYNKITATTEGATSRLVQLTDCVCLGYEVTYECTVCGDGALATLWSGSLFECLGGKITLRHSQFENSTSGECNSGTVIARSSGVDMDCHISQLTLLNLTQSYHNYTVKCSYINNTSLSIVDEISVPITIGKLIVRLLN